MKLQSLFVTFLLVLLFQSFFCKYCLAAPQKKIGIVLALSGPVGFQGNSMKNAMLLAKEKFDKENLLELIFEDDGFQAKNTVSAVQKLIVSQKVDLLVVFGANQGNAVLDIIKAAQLPLISLSVVETLAARRDYVTTFLPSTTSLMKRSAEEIKKRGYSSIAVVATQQDACVLQLKHLRDAAVTNILLEEEVLPAELDLRTIATKIRKLNPQAVFISMIPPQGSTFARQLRSIGYRGQLITTLQVANLSELKSAQGALTGAWAVSGDSRSADSFLRDYQLRFNEDTTFEALYAYDLIPVLLAAVKKGEINTFLHSPQNLEGITGKFTLSSNGVTEFPVIVKTFKEDRFEVSE